MEGDATPDVDVRQADVQLGVTSSPRLNVRVDRDDPIIFAEEDEPQRPR